MNTPENYWQTEATNARRAIKSQRLELAAMRRLAFTYAVAAIVGWGALVVALLVTK